MRILVLEHDPGEARRMRKAFEAEQFAVDVPPPGNDSLELATETQYDVIILSLSSIPIGVLKKLRSRGVKTPVIVLDSSGSPETRCKAIEFGADDCLAKPYLSQELIMHVRALLRRPLVLIDILRVGDLELDNVRRRVVRQGKCIQLKPKEFAVLEYLMRNPGRTITRTALVEHVWNGRFEGLSNIVDVYINFLRSKVDRDFEPKLIHTVHGIGYMLVDHVSEAVA